MSPRDNRLLSALPEHVLVQVRQAGEIVQLPSGHIVVQAHSDIDHALFPIDAVFSVVAMSDVGDGEVGMIGREGTTALPLLFGSDRSAQKVVAQISGNSVRISAERLRALIDDHHELRSVLLRYAQCWATQVAQTSLANARNTVRERLSRWLVMCQDRLETNDIAITHEALATILGVRRPGVTVATHELEGEGGIRARRGLIRILDREKLTADARSSYGVAEREYERLLVDALPGSRSMRGFDRQAA